MSLRTTGTSATATATAAVFRIVQNLHLLPRRHLRFYSSTADSEKKMTTQPDTNDGGKPGAAAAAAAAAKKKAAASAGGGGKKELRILMLHGYTQSGPLFDSKTKALGKLLTKALGPAPYNLTPRLIFPTGPHRLRARDIPGFVPSEGGEADQEDEEDGDNWGWWRKDDATGTYAGFEAGMRTVAAAIRDAAPDGGIDGVLGFSQGGCLAALVAAALEVPRREPPVGCPAPSPSGGGAAEPDWSWVQELRDANAGQPLKFAVVYSGFWAPVPGLQWLYDGTGLGSSTSSGEGPGSGEMKEGGKIATPTLHFLGSLDSVVEEGRSRALVDRCADPRVAVHSGGHYVPVARDRVMPLVGFLREVLARQEGGEEGGKL